MLEKIRVALEKHDRTSNAIDHPSIAALRELPEEKQNDLLEVCRCFVANPPNKHEAAAAYKVCMAVIMEIAPEDHQYSKNSIFLGLHILNKANLLTEENFCFIKQNPTFLTQCADLLEKLHEAHFLTEQSLHLMKENPDVWMSADDILRLSEADILTEENVKLIIHLKNNNAFGLLDLLDNSPLTQVTLNLLNRVPPNNLKNVMFILFLLRDASIHTRKNFDQLLSPTNACLLTDDAVNTIWHCVCHKNKLTQEIFDQLIIHASQDMPIQALRHYAMQLLKTWLEELETEKISLETKLGMLMMRLLPPPLKEETYLAHLTRALQEQRNRLTAHIGTSSQCYFSLEHPAAHAVNTLLSILNPTETESKGETLTDEMVDFLCDIQPLNSTIQEALPGTLFEEEEEDRTRQFLELLRKGSRAVVSLLNTPIRREDSQLRYK